MLERFAAGRDVDHWRRIHDRVNGVISAGDVELVADLIRDNPPDSTLGISTGRGRCCG